MEVLKQGQGEPYSVEQEVAAIFLGTRGHLDPVPVPKTSAGSSEEFLDHAAAQRGRRSSPASARAGSSMTTARRSLADLVESFKSEFEAGDGSSVVDDSTDGSSKADSSKADSSKEDSSKEDSSERGLFVREVVGEVFGRVLLEDREVLLGRVVVGRELTG